MINGKTEQNLSDGLSIKAQKLYKQVKAFVIETYSLIKKDGIEEIKNNFHMSYIRFARQLKIEGYDDQCYQYMAICEMYYFLIDRPDELIAHKDFFTKLFNDFDELFYTRINCPQDYEEKLAEYKINFRKVRRYYYTKVYIPSPHYDEEVLGKIMNGIFKIIE